MATKTNLITAINTQLTAIITQAKVRLASLEIVNELFPSSHSMVVNLLTPNVISYDLKFSKQGNECRVTGFVKNGFPYMIGSQNLLTIDNSLYFGKTGENTIIPIVGNETLSNGLVEVIGDKIYLLTNLGAGHSFRINASYKVND